MAKVYTVILQEATMLLECHTLTTEAAAVDAATNLIADALGLQGDDRAAVREHIAEEYVYDQEDGDYAVSIFDNEVVDALERVDNAQS